MPFSTKESTSCDQPPTCAHRFHTQTHLSPLPPLYFTPPPSPSSSSSSPSSSNPPTILPPSTITALTQALTTLGTPHTHTPFINKDILALRKELEEGMSSERRQVMQFYVLGIKDVGKRRAAELYLARYRGFVMGVDGRLGFRLREGGEGGGKGLDGARGRRGGCGVM
ncbi:hypothetical protein WAI453_012071 [Rhynchosporium graminicola]